VISENGPIKKGDSLVIASIPSYAMTGTERDHMFSVVLEPVMDFKFKSLKISDLRRFCLGSDLYHKPFYFEGLRQVHNRLQEGLGSLETPLFRYSSDESCA
jgi:hypothetical protein